MKCPSCQHLLTPDEISAGMCPACGRSLPDSEGVDIIRNQIDQLWSHSIDLNFTPTMTIKRPSEDTKPPSQLVLKPHSFANSQQPDLPEADYELLNILGEGGMGVVYAARQTSMGRSIALKMIKPEFAGKQAERSKFLAEAAVTGDLDHPNIVPVYDLGTNDRGDVFYSMKQVCGVPWSKAIRQKTQTENLEILMRVADAVAFAHSRDVIHRDLKPENVMLGDFGEVLLMDWGLAVSMSENGKAESLSELGRPAGTPAYMAPEMAMGEAAKIGPASDVYLLGAILYEIVTGNQAHTANTTLACLYAAAKNKIVETDQEGELVNTARQAMATNPEERFESVKAFQNAVRAYQQHEESIALSTRARQALGAAKAEKDYRGFARCIFQLEEALTLWQENMAAEESLSVGRYAYASCALQKGDLDLAVSVLDGDDAVHQDLIKQVQSAQKERGARQKRLKMAKTTSMVSAAAALLIFGTAFFWIRAEQTKTVAQKNRAEQALADYETEQVRRHADRKASAPAYVKSAKILVEQSDFDSAMAMTRTAIDYDPWLAPAYVLQALLLARSDDNRAAAQTCSRYLELEPDHEDAKWLLQICREREVGQSATDAYLEDLAAMSARLGMPTLAASFYGSLAKQIEYFREKVELAMPGSGNELRVDDEGRLTLKIKNARNIALLSRLKGLPLSHLDLAGCQTDDLTPLSGIPLKSLDLTRTRVADLSPLADMSLVSLNLNGTEVSDLSPLQGMPIESLSIMNTQISDLSPLKGAPLQELVIERTHITDLSPLAGMPLKGLSLHKVQVHDLSPLRGAPLERLRLIYVQVNDLSPLAGMPLTSLDLGSSGVKDLSPLKGMPLKYLWTRDQNIKDRGPLQGMPLEELRTGGDKIDDLSPLRGMQLKKLSIGGGSTFSDLSPLQGQPIEDLRINSSNVTDLSPIKGMPLKILHIPNTYVSDLSPLAGMELVDLYFTPGAITIGIEVIRAMASLRSIAWRKGDPLPAREFWELYDKGEFDAPQHRVWRYRIPVHQAWPGAAAGLTWEEDSGFSLSLQGRKNISDLTPLKSIPLDRLNLLGTGVTDLTPLKGMKLSSLSFNPRDITNGIAAIRGMPSLTKIHVNTGSGREVALFWQQYDAGEFDKK